MKKLSNKAIESIKNHIDEHLRVRCIPAKVIVKQDNEKLRVSSNKFNTIPVIHSEIEIVDFGGSIGEKLIGDKKCPEVYCRIHAAYEGNGVHLFNISGWIDWRDRFISYND